MIASHMQLPDTCKENQLIPFWAYARVFCATGREAPPSETVHIVL